VLRRTARSLQLLALLVLAGCSGGDDPVKPVAVLPDPPLPANDSPAGALTRLDAALELQSANGYRDLLTADFGFLFSNQTDPSLVTKYGTSWNRTDEDTAVRHLFNGFTDDLSVHHSGVTTISVTFEGVAIADDSVHVDSLAWYKVAQISHMLATMTIPSDNGDGPVTFSIDAHQDLWLVRGDAAILPAGIAADSTHWYVRQWADLSSQPYSRLDPTRKLSLSALPTWGHIKASYR